MSWKNTWLVLVVVVVLGTGLRAYDLGNNSFVSDEFLDMNSSYGYFKTGEWKAWDFNFGKESEVNRNEARDERANVYKWQVAQLFRFLPPTEATARTVSVLWGVVSMLAIFWATLVFTGKKEIGLLSAFLFAVSVSGIEFNRHLRMYAMFFPVYLLLATTVYLSLEREYRGSISFLRMLWEKVGINALFVPFALAFGILSILTHQLTAVIVFSLAAYFLVSGISVYRKEGRWKNKYFAFFSTGVILFGLLSLLAPKLVQSFTAGLIFFDDHYSYVGYVLRDFWHPLFGVLLIVCGVYCLFRDKNRSAAWYLSLSFLVPLVLAIWFFRRNAGPQYIFFAQSFGMILAAIGIYRLWEVIREKFPEWGKRGMLSVFATLFLLVPNYGYFFEENNTYHETSSGSNPNYRKVFALFKKEQLSTDALITRNFRNYYFSGAKVRVFDLGDEIDRKRMTVNEFLLIRETHPTGWVILSDNDMSDYISKDLKTYFEKNLMRVSNESVRGAVFVYAWK